LVENYEANTLERFIIKEYAYTNSIIEITRRLNRRGYLLNGKTIEKEYVRDVINSKPSDELHRILRSGYLQISRHNRKQSVVK
jgi:hypothetical protein